MKFLGIMFLVSFILFFLFAKVKVNGSAYGVTIFQRACACFLGSLVFTAILGLPILGIIYLFVR